MSQRKVRRREVRRCWKRRAKERRRDAGEGKRKEQARSVGERRGGAVSLISG